VVGLLLVAEVRFLRGRMQFSWQKNPYSFPSEIVFRPASMYTPLEFGADLRRESKDELVTKLANVICGPNPRT
jgi:hypothetical protein